ncbi:MAG TPA: threonine ammonia-lyase, biosynthetic [Polyangiaceae bacterium]|nr:threonine ammonia-lyase, biosynthetic [Polyangiaceae bacterium]
MDEMLKRVLNARVTEVLPEPTPLTGAPGLSRRLGVPVWLKREDLTPVFSFKLRGAYNRIALLGDDELGRGIIAASAGNHAQGVAFASRRRGARCRIVMPRTTPDIKIAAVKSYGAEIDLFGDNYSDAAGHARELAASTGMTVVPPFDDLDVIAGQGTVGLEILRQAPRELGAILVPVGGGGLISGVAAVIKELRPEVRVIGVQPEDSAAMAQSLATGQRVTLDHVGIFADGVAVRQVGEYTLALTQRYVDEIIQVSQDEICAAIQDAFLETRTLLEPAGALSIAGLKRYVARAPSAQPGHAHVAVASGANISLSRLGYIAERAEVGEDREALFAVTIPEQPGSFLTFCGTLGKRSVTEFNYRLSSRTQAHVFIGVRVDGARGAREVESALAAQGYTVSDLTHDELAKTHVRHMVGGLGQGVQDEVLYTFEFPERPGALLQFLTALGGRWNISLFHYRNHGTGFGRVLCGFEVPLAERAEFAAALEGLGFNHRSVGDSPVTRFLSSGR